MSGQIFGRKINLGRNTWQENDPRQGGNGRTAVGQGHYEGANDGLDYDRETILDTKNSRGGEHFVRGN